MLYLKYMGLYLKKDESRAQLNSKVMSDLSQRLNSRALDNNDAKHALLLKNQRKTTNGGLFWASIIAIVVLALAVYVIFIF